MNDDIRKQEIHTENSESLRLNQVMRQIRSIMNEKRKRGIMQRLLLNKKKPKTKPQGW